MTDGMTIAGMTGMTITITTDPPVRSSQARKIFRAFFVGRIVNTNQAGEEAGRKKWGAKSKALRRSIRRMER